MEERGIRPDRVIHLFLYGSLQAGFLRGLAGAVSVATLPQHVIASLLTVGFGLFDELHQIPVPDREFEWSDILFDALGAALASGLVLLLRLRRRLLR